MSLCKRKALKLWWKVLKDRDPGCSWIQRGKSPYWKGCGEEQEQKTKGKWTVSTDDNPTGSFCSGYQCFNIRPSVPLVPVAGSLIKRVTFAGLKATNQNAWEKQWLHQSLAPSFCYPALLPLLTNLNAGRKHCYLVQYCVRNLFNGFVSFLSKMAQKFSQTSPFSKQAVTQDITRDSIF